MKTFFFALVGLALLYSYGATAASIERNVIVIKRGTNVADVRAYLDSHKIRYKLVRDANRNARWLVAWTTPQQTTSTLDHFGASQISIDKDAVRKPSMLTKTLSAPNREFSSLNQWGLMRVNGHTPDLYRKGGSAIADTRVKGLTYGALPNTDGEKGCVLDGGTAWDHPALADRVIAQFNRAYDYLNAAPCELGVLANGDYDCAANIPPALIVSRIPQPPEDRNRYCLNVDYDPTKPASAEYLPCGYADNAYGDFWAEFYQDHGTAVASLMFGENRNVRQPNIDVQGVAPTARGIVGKVGGWHWVEDEEWVPPRHHPNAVRPWKYEYSIFASDVAAGISECAYQQARVINISIGGAYGTEAERQAIAEATANGVIVVASAGNDSDPSQGIIGFVNYPAAYPNVIAVSAMGLDGRIASFSSQGYPVDFIAPGVAIVAATKDVVEGDQEFSDDPYYRMVHEGCETTNSAYEFCDSDKDAGESPYAYDGYSSKPFAVAPGGVDFYGMGRIPTYEYLDGTSFAAPLVSGVLLRMLSAHPFLSGDDLRAQTQYQPVREQGQGVPLVDLNIR